MKYLFYAIKGDDKVFERRRKSTNNLFLKVCRKNGILFNKHFNNQNNFNVIDNNGNVVKINKDFNMFDDYEISKKGN